MADARDFLSVLLGHREVAATTDAEDFRYIRHHWGSAYTVIRPGNAMDTWKAIAKFGNGDQLIADTADVLLDLIRHHYGPETAGYTEMLMENLGRKYT